MKDVNRDRDSGFDRLLAGALAQGAAAPGAGIDAACIDADTLAAWADEALTAGKRAAVEAHAADCARCQALLAAMVRTAPPPAAAPSIWRLPALGWLVPAGAVAAALVAWAIIPGRLAEPPQPAVATAPAASVAVAPAATPASEPKVAPQTQQDSAANAMKTAARPPAGTRDTDLERRRKDTAQAKKQTITPIDGSLTALDKTTPRAADRLETKAAAAPSAAPVGEAKPAPSPPAAAAAAPVERGFTAGRMAETVNIATTTVIVSPDPASRWRLVPSRGVERSTDGGSTWQPQETPAGTTLSAGASPSPSVCWLVGPGGTVLLSTDGRFWRRLVFPENVGLVSVIATDARTATVTTSDGRRLSTTDGGLTWAPPGAR